MLRIGKGKLKEAGQTIIPVIGVIYHSKDGNWRGFCYPYDLTCNAKTKDEAREKLTSLVETYEEVLSKYNSPRHLVEKNLTDAEDRKIFKEVWPEISKTIVSHIKTASSPEKYTSNFSRTVVKSFSTDDVSGLFSYSHRGVPALV